MSAKSKLAVRPANSQHGQWPRRIFATVVRKPELTVAATRVSIAPSHIAISPPRLSPAQPIRFASTSLRVVRYVTHRITSHSRSPMSVRPFS